MVLLYTFNQIYSEIWKQKKLDWKELETLQPVHRKSEKVYKCVTEKLLSAEDISRNKREPFSLLWYKRQRLRGLLKSVMPSLPSETQKGRVFHENLGNSTVLLPRGNWELYFLFSGECSAVAAIVQATVDTAHIDGRPWCCSCGVGSVGKQNERVRNSWWLSSRCQRKPGRSERSLLQGHSPNRELQVRQCLLEL